MQYVSKGQERMGELHGSSYSEAPQSEANHREDVLSLAKERLDLLALPTGNPIGLGFHDSAGVVAGFLLMCPLQS